MSIQITNISKSFAAFKALDTISLSFADGELTALLGPSGSGKTTLLRLIAGLDIPDKSEGSSIMFDGADVSQLHARYRRVGFVFQHYALFRHLTVFENIAFGLRVKKGRDRPSRKVITQTVRELLSLIQLESLATRMPSELSGGQRQRVAFARALAIQPKVLLLDEPFGALDANVRAEMRAWLRGLHDKLHFTSVFVTHDQDEALELADKIVVLNRGRIEQIGTPDQIFHHPANEFVMKFMGDVNVIHAPVHDSFLGDPSSKAQGDQLKLRHLIRPHDFQIYERTAPEGLRAISATITKIQTAGPIVKIECVDETRNPILVHVSHAEFRSFTVQPGHTIFLCPRNGRTFDV